MEITGIKYIAPCLDNSGYAQASRNNILALYRLGVPVTVAPMTFETARPDLGADGVILDSLINKNINYNVVIIHSTPEFWEKYREEGKVNIGYTIWETTKLHHDWKNYINKNVSMCLVGCEWNISVFKESGVTIPIVSIPHCVDTTIYNNITPYHIGGVSDTTFLFYSIFQWCYDDQTRVLTRSGFKYFKDLSYEDEVATLNKETEELEYYFPDKIVKFYRKDKMLELLGNQFNLCVTPDHKMVVKSFDKVDKSTPWELKPFNELIVNKRNREGIVVSSKYRTKKNCIWKGKEEAIFKIPKPDGYNYNSNKLPSEINMDDFLTFLGWYLSEGSIEISRNYYRIAITQIKNVKYIEEIISCISALGFSSFIHNGKDIVFNSRDLCLYLKQFSTHDQKFVPNFIKDLSSRQIKLFLTSLFKGDGSIYSNGDWTKYVTTSKKLAEDVVECLLKVGMSGSVSPYDPKLKTPGKIGDRTVVGKKVQYTVSVNRYRNEPSMYYSNIREIDYDGFVYCASVKNHTMLVERNGKIIFSGNTERKSPISLIKAYWHAFKEQDDVGLVLKTYRSSYADSEKEAIRQSIARLKYLAPYESYPKIYLISDMLSNEEIAGLHKRGNCYVSLDRGEGFGLSPFLAGSIGKPIIVTGFGGSTEYAKPDNSYLVNYTLTPVSGMPWSPWYRGEQLWAEPDVKHGADLMKYVYSNKEEAYHRGSQLQQYIHTNFSYEIIGNKIISALNNL